MTNTKTMTITIPIFSQIQNSPSLITWRLIETKMCWGVIFLLGGGFALANASQVDLLILQQKKRFYYFSLIFSPNICLFFSTYISLGCRGVRSCQCCPDQSTSIANVFSCPGSSIPDLGQSLTHSLTHSLPLQNFDTKSDF